MQKEQRRGIITGSKRLKNVKLIARSKRQKVEYTDTEHDGRGEKKKVEYTDTEQFETHWFDVMIQKKRPAIMLFILTIHKTRH